MANKDRKSVLSYLKVLMVHVIKWKSQPDKRSSSWIGSINNAKKGIARVQRKVPSIKNDFIKENWDSIFQKATEKAEEEMGQKSTVSKLNWADLFLNKYTWMILLVAAIVGFFG